MSEPVALFIDESGDSESCLVLATLIVPLPFAEAAGDIVTAVRDRLLTAVPALASYGEFHAVQLARRPTRGRRRKRTARGLATLTLDEQVQIIDALFGAFEDIPGARLLVVDHRWTGSASPPGHGKGHRQRLVMKTLVERVTSNELTIGSAIVDHGSHLTHYRSGYNEAAAEAPTGTVRADLASVPSHDDVRVQLADLLAFAAYHAIHTENSSNLIDGFHGRFERHVVQRLIAPDGALAYEV